MDLESRFIECCIACNSSQQCQSNDSPSIHVQGQGDCKCNSGYRDSQNYCLALEKEKKFKTKFAREKNELKPRQEAQNKLLDIHCECFEKEDFSDKIRHESSQDEKYESCGYCWDSPYSSWRAKTDRYFIHGQTKPTIYSNEGIIMAENHLGFKEKVDFLFRIFKDYGQDFASEGFAGRKKKTSFKGGDFADFNRRLCAAEEGIEKLAFIVGDLVEDLKKKRATEGLLSSDTLDFDDMSVVQRINYLKSKNDLFLSFMKAFFKAGKAEEVDPRVDFLPEIYETKPQRYSERNYSKESTREEVVEMLKKLRVEMTELRKKKSQNLFEQHVPKKEKEGENALKFAGNKLEVISEQAELVLSDDSGTDDFSSKHPIQTLKENFLPVSEESDESDSGVQEVPPTFISQETELVKSSFGKVNFIKSHLEHGSVHSRTDSTEKKNVSGNSLKDRSKNEDETNFNTLSVSEISCSFYESEDSDKSVERKRSHSGGEVRQKETREEEEQTSSKEPTRRPNSSSARKTDESSKNPSSGKTFQKNSYTVLLPSKLTRKGYSIPDVCSSSREESKREARVKELRQRPVTDPSSERKTSPPSGLKPFVQGTCPKKNSGIHNVRKKNKILLSKKSCVETS